MNRQECESLIEDYLTWLRTGLSIRECQNACEITTPFLDRHNDHLQLYVTRKNDTFVISDDGYILSDLRTSGMEVSTPSRKAVFDSMLNGFGVKTDKSELFVEASAKNLPQRLHALVQAMLSVNDMFVLSKPRVASIFWDDVRQFLDDHEVRYVPRVKLSGKSGFDHAIDFLIPKSKDSPERLLQAINSPNKNSITNYLWTLNDSREGRGQDSVAIAFLNDEHQSVGGDLVEALEAYQVKPAFWSRREEYVPTLAA